MAHGHDDHASLGLASTPQRIHFGLFTIVVALRRAGDSWTSRGIAYDYHPDLGPVSISAPAGYGGGFFCAVTVGDDGFDRGAKKNTRTKGLQHGRRQRRPAAVDQSRKRTNAGAALCFGHFVAFGVSALLDSSQGSALAGVGFAAYLGQFHAGNSDRNHWHIARDLNRLHYESQSVRRRALSDIFRVGSVGDSGHCVGG